MTANNEYDNSSGSEDEESVGAGSFRRPEGRGSGGEEEQEEDGAAQGDFGEEDD